MAPQPLVTSAGAPKISTVEADQGAGLAVVPGIGSSVLTMRTVGEDEPRDDAVLVDAPFVGER